MCIAELPKILNASDLIITRNIRAIQLQLIAFNTQTMIVAKQFI